MHWLPEVPNLPDRRLVCQELFSVIMAFDRLDTNTIVTLHSSGSRRVGGTLQTSAEGVSKTCKTDTRAGLCRFRCGTSGSSQGGGTQDPELVWGEYCVSASCEKVNLSGFECPYWQGRWTAPEKVICTILEAIPEERDESFLQGPMSSSKWGSQPRISTRVL